jgi:hypothetical protein
VYVAPGASAQFSHWQSGIDQVLRSQFDPAFAGQPQDRGLMTT